MILALVDIACVSLPALTVETVETACAYAACSEKLMVDTNSSNWLWAALW